MRHSSEAHNVARLRVFIGEKQEAFAKLIGCSVHTLQSIETGRLKLSEDLAWRMSGATGVHFRWLMDNNLSAKFASASGGRYSKSEFERVQANKKVGSPEFVQHMVRDYAASFYGQIRAILSSAGKKDLAEVAVWKVAKFLDDCREEFGHDERLIESKEQFGLRADYSPYLKFRQIDAGISLFRKYDRDRSESIRRTLKALKERKPLVTDMGTVQIVMKCRQKSGRKSKQNRQRAGNDSPTT
jgi:transcriptional regulator with XRE-family HTH domain